MRRVAGLAGTVGPVLFFAVLLTEGAIRPGYRPLRDTLALLVGGIASMSPPGQPPRIGNDYAGLLQRLDVAVFLAWQMIVARRIARQNS